jgi:hypothetical protein
LFVAVYLFDKQENWIESEEMGLKFSSREHPFEREKSKYN